MKKPLPKSERKVRIWSDVTPELKEKTIEKAKKETAGNTSAYIRILLEKNV